jgi:hypothetical protein
MLEIPLEQSNGNSAPVAIAREFPMPQLDQNFRNGVIEARDK